MKNLLLAATALVGMATAAAAADLPRRAVPVAPVPVAVPAFTWTGIYAGITAAGAVGGDFGVLSLDPALPVGVTMSNGGWLAGGTVGANYQFTPGSGIVIGVEGDIAYSDIHNRTGVGILGFGQGFAEAKTDGLFATARGRLGYAFDRFLVYGTGGYAYTDASFSLGAFDAARNPVFAGTAKGNLDGYVVGGGVEYAFTNNMSVKAEYLYADFDAKRFNFVSTAGNGPIAAKLDTHLLKVGLNYRFGGSGLGLFGY